MNTPGKSEEDILLVQRSDGILRLVLNRPQQRNALSHPMMAALQAQFDMAKADAQVRAVILAARGPAFCAGHDLKEMRGSTDPGFFNETVGMCERLMLSIVRCPKPVIAEVQGIATAAGCQLVASCDLAVAAEDATFATPGVHIGLFCSTPMVALTRNVGRKQAMHMLLTGDAINAGTARDWGLVNEAVPAADLETATRALALKLAAKSPLTLAIGKEAFYAQADLDLDGAYRLASETMIRNMMARDAGEGIDAFVQKRKPVWTGT